MLLQKDVRVWSIGMQAGIEYEEALSKSLPELRYQQMEIFPVGGFIYITDEVFQKKPRLALTIIQHFFAKIENIRLLPGPASPWHEVADACLLWRLCVRPELTESLFQRCEANQDKLAAGDADIQRYVLEPSSETHYKADHDCSCADLYTLLGETNYIEQDDPVAPLSLVPDKYPILSERRIIAEEQPVDYFNTLKRSQEEANLNMIRYYAGLQVDLRRDYRHFFVVHTEPGAPYIQRWKEEIQTIAGVITPEECIKELENHESGLFDFCERYMS